MHPILQKLQNGDMRTTGMSDEVVKDVLRYPYLFEEVFEGLYSDDPGIKMRSADVLEKVSYECHRYLQPFKDRLIDEISKTDQKEVQWHVAAMFSYLELNRIEKGKVVRILFNWLENSKSKIVKVMCLQSLSHFAMSDSSLREKLIPIIHEMQKNEGAAVNARASMLLAQLN